MIPQARLLPVIGNYPGFYITPRDIFYCDDRITKPNDKQGESLKAKLTITTP